jgi:hypothetical protein
MRARMAIACAVLRRLASAINSERSASLNVTTGAVRRLAIATPVADSGEKLARKQDSMMSRTSDSGH